MRVFLLIYTIVGVGYTACSAFTQQRCFLKKSSVCPTTSQHRQKQQGLHLTSSSSSSSVVISVGENLSQNVQVSFPSNLQSINKLFLRVTWVSWWFQIILSVISGVILVFANTVRGPGALLSSWVNGFSFSCVGTLIALANAFWTWNSTRLLRRYTLKKINEENFLPTLRKYARMSITLSLAGMFATLLGSEQVVGTLASKVLNNQGFVPTIMIAQPGAVNNAASNTLQALDIFLVQANTNAMVSHFVPLLSFVSLLTQMPQVVFKNMVMMQQQGQGSSSSSPTSTDVDTQIAS